MAFLDKAKKAAEQIAEKLAAKKPAGEASALSKGADLLAEPQRQLLGFVSEKLGGKGAKNSEQASQQIVEKLAERLGIPEDSTAGNVAKALGVAGLETFADPTNIIPVGKIAKFAPKFAPKLASAIKAAGKIPNPIETAMDRLVQAPGKIIQTVGKSNYAGPRLTSLDEALQFGPKADPKFLHRGLNPLKPHKSAAQVVAEAAQSQQNRATALAALQRLAKAKK